MVPSSHQQQPLPPSAQPPQRPLSSTTANVAHRPPLPRAAPPRLGQAFQPWNSVGAGHQRAEARGVTSSTGWRDLRNRKIWRQLGGGVGKGLSIEGEGRSGGRSVIDMLHGGGGAKASDRGPKQRDSHSEGPAVPYVDVPKPTPTPIPASGPPASTLTEATASVKHSPDGQRCRKGIFAGLTVYINGSTAPLVSDHRLKQLLAEEGARLSLHLGRRAVTHVILGKPNHRVGGSGSDKMVAKDGEGRDRGWCGGGLAGGKLDREIRRIRGEGVRFVGVEWVLESIRAGKRLPEARFATLKMSAAGQGSVYHEFAAAGRTKANSASACTVVNEGTDAVPPSGQSAVE